MNRAWRNNVDKASHTSVYYTPGNESGGGGKDIRKRRRQKSRRIHIRRHSQDSKNQQKPILYTKKCSQAYDPVGESGRRSVSTSPDSTTSSSRSKHRIYIPVRPSYSDQNPSQAGACSAPLDRIKLRHLEDKKVHLTVHSTSPHHRVKKPVKRKPVYRPKCRPQVDCCTQAEVGVAHKECQSGGDEVVLCLKKKDTAEKGCARDEVSNCCRGEQCELLRDSNNELDDGIVSSLEYNCKEGHREEDECFFGGVDKVGGTGWGKPSRGNRNRDGRCCRNSRERSTYGTRHPFPFCGKSPSGNLKVNPEMVSFENDKISILVANPKKTRTRHQEIKGRMESCRRKSPVLRRCGPVSPRRCDPVSPRRCDPVSHRKCDLVLKERGPVLHRNYSEEMTAWADAAASPTLLLHRTHRESSNNLVQHEEKYTGNKTSSIKSTYEYKLESFRDPGFDPKVAIKETKSREKTVEILNSGRRQTPHVPTFPRDSSPGLSSRLRTTDGYTTGGSDGTTAESLVRGSRGTKDFMENLHYRVKRAIHPDTKVVIGDTEFPVHSVALQIHSKYFDNIKRPLETVHKVELPESIVSPDDFQHVMDWVLTSEKDRELILTRDNVIGLYSTAQYLGIGDLKAQCLKFVQEQVDAEDPKLIKLWEYAHTKPRTKELIGILSQKLTKLFPKLYKSRQFLKLDVNELVTLLDSDEVVIDSEMEIFDAAVRWLLYDWPDRKQNTVKVMSTIRFGLLSPLQLTQMKFLADDKEVAGLRQIFSFDSVKKMQEDGLAFAVLKQSYGKRSGELNKWIRDAKVKPPRPRHHLDSEPGTDTPIKFSNYNEALTKEEEGDLDPLEANAALKQSDAAKISKSIDVRPSRKNYNIKDKRSLVRDKILFESDNEDPEEGALEMQKSQTTGNVSKKQSTLPPGVVPHLTNSDPFIPPYTDSMHLPSVHASNKRLDPEDKNSGEYLNNSEKTSELKAAVTIQRWARGYVARKKIHDMQNAAVLIQHAYRAFRGKIKNEYKPIKLAPELKSLAPHSTAALPSKKSSYSSKTPEVKKNLDITKGALFMFGGADPQSRLGPENPGNEIWMYVLDVNIWMRVGLMPEPRTHFGIARLEDVVYLVGGTDPRYKTSNERNITVKSVWKLDLRSGEWSFDANLPTDLPDARSHFGCVARNGIVYVIGGNDVDAKSLSTCEKYEVQYNGWTAMAPLDGPRISMGVEFFQDHIWIVGGLSKNRNIPVLKSVLCYDIPSNSWTAVKSLPLPRAFCALVTIEDHLYVFGGAGQRDKGNSKQTSLPDVLKFDMDKDKWLEVGLLDLARHGHTATVIDNQVVIVGGVNSVRMDSLKSVEVYDVKTSRVTRVRSLSHKLSGMGVVPAV